MTADPELDFDCIECGEVSGGIILEEKCPASHRQCGHHCNHSWTHDHCHWCGAEWGEDGTRVDGQGPG